MGTRTDYRGLGGDNLGCALGSIGHFGRKPVSFLDQGLDNLRLGNGLDDLTLNKDLALAVTAGNTQVSISSFSWYIHHASHDRDPQRNRHTLEPFGDVLSECVDIDLRPPTTRARHNLELALAQVQRFQNLEPDFDFLSGRSLE